MSASVHLFGKVKLSPTLCGRTRSSRTRDIKYNVQIIRTLPAAGGAFVKSTRQPNRVGVSLVRKLVQAESMAPIGRVMSRPKADLSRKLQLRQAHKRADSKKSQNIFSRQPALGPKIGSTATMVGTVANNLAPAFCRLLHLFPAAALLRAPSGQLSSPSAAATKRWPNAADVQRR